MPRVRDRNGLAVFTGILSSAVEVQAGRRRERSQKGAGRRFRTAPIRGPGAEGVMVCRLGDWEALGKQGGAGPV